MCMRIAGFRWERSWHTYLDERTSQLLPKMVFALLSDAVFTGTSG